ncbi:MAG TPA: hypothetical protein VGK01_08530 [Candidatus Angelobacter sp.]|jgi:hypothetical protein
MTISCGDKPIVNGPIRNGKLMVELGDVGDAQELVGVTTPGDGFHIFQPSPPVAQVDTSLAI